MPRGKDQIFEALLKRGLAVPPLDVDALLRRAAAAGLCRDGVVCREPWLVLAPIGYAVAHCISFDPTGRQLLTQSRRAHVEMLCELLEPAAPGLRSA